MYVKQISDGRLHVVDDLHRGMFFNCSQYAKLDRRVIVQMLIGGLGSNEIAWVCRCHTRFHICADL